MTTEQILQECKNEVARSYGHADYETLALLENKLTNINVMGDVANLYAQKIAELFAEWIRTFEALQIEPANRQWYVESQITTSELYTEFLNQLNSTK